MIIWAKTINLKHKGSRKKSSWDTKVGGGYNHTGLHSEITLRGKFWGEGAKFDRLRSETYFTTLTGILDLSLEDLPFRDKGGGERGIGHVKAQQKENKLSYNVFLLEKGSENVIDLKGKFQV